MTDAARSIGLDDFEIENTINSAFDKTAGVVRMVPEQPPAPTPSVAPESPPESHQSHGNDDVWGEFKPVDGFDFMFNGDETTAAIWGEGNDILWAKGEALMIAGVMGLGKTTLAGRVLRAQLGLENEVLGMPVMETERPILYLAMDRPKQIARSMRRQFSREDAKRVNGRLIVRQGPPIMDMAVDPMLLTRMALEAGAGTVYLDSLKDAVVGLVADEVAASYNRARQNLLARDIDLCELHHMVKRNVNGGIPSGIADVYGSAWLTAGVGSVITLSGQPGDLIIKFKHAKLPADEVGPWRLHHDPDKGLMEVVEFNLIMAVDQAGEHGVTAKDVAKAMYETNRPSDAEAKRVARKLDALVKKGLLTRIEGHRGGNGGSVPTTWFLATKTAEDAPEPAEIF